MLAGEERVAPYATDESRLGPYPPEAVVLCETPEEVAAVLRLAKEHRVPVTPRGAGTGTTGGAVPVRGGIVLSTECMRRILDIREKDLVAVVEPGVVLAVLQERVEERGLFYPPDPASLESCSLGGNVAENAGGPRAFKYGVTRHYVLGLELVLVGGERLRCGRHTVKGVTGYDLVSLIVGSEGTLAVVTEIVLRLLAKPEAVMTLLAVMPDAEKAACAVHNILRLGESPSVLEIMDGVTMDHIRRSGKGRPLPEAGAAVLCEFDGPSDLLEPLILRAAEACERAMARDVFVARDERERRGIWQARRNASVAFRELHRFKVAHDIAVPLGAIQEMLRQLGQIGARHGLTIGAYGHAGDGNLHVNIVHDEDPEDPRVARRVEAAVEELFRGALSLGGTLSGEHGVGLTKRRYLGWEQQPSVIALEKSLKRVFDPDGLLNPGKVFPEPV